MRLQYDEGQNIGFIFFQKRGKEENIMFKDKRTAMVGTLVAALFLSLLTVMAPGKASAAYECWVKIEGEKIGVIQGESTVKGKENLIEIISWSLGGSVPTDPASGLPKGKGILQPFRLTMRTSKASLPLFQTLTTGEHLKSVTLTARKPSTTTTAADYLEIRLEDAQVISFVNLGNSKSTEAYPIEEVVLVYKKMKIQYRPTKPDGSLGTPVEVEFEWGAPAKS
jgi:type VI secretion system secreted protein Hcp